MRSFLRLCAVSLVCFPCWATDTGWIIASGGSTSDYLGSVTWLNPSRVTADDGSYASCAAAANDHSDWLRGTFTVSIPVGATIDGIEVKYQAYRSSLGPEELSCFLVIGGTQVGTEGSGGHEYGSTPADIINGSPTYKWGTTPTRDQVVAAGFGFEIVTDDIDSGSDTVYVDAMWIKVYYTEVGSPPLTNAAAVAGMLEGEG